jgi:hypothetical protein
MDHPSFLNDSLVKSQVPVKFRIDFQIFNETRLDLMSILKNIPDLIIFEKYMNCV